jgi:hypothetical protein
VDTHIARFAGYSQPLETIPVVWATLTSTTFEHSFCLRELLSGERKCA